MFICCSKKSNVVIIDWDSAMEQCGGDEKFLKKLLSETHKEITKNGKLSDYSENFTREYAHMVKGVSQNLFCKDLEKSSSELEFVIIRKEDKKEVNKKINNMEISISRFENFLKDNKII